MEKYFIEDVELFTPSTVVAERRASKYIGDYEGLTTGHIVKWIDLSQFEKKKGK